MHISGISKWKVLSFLLSSVLVSCSSNSTGSNNKTDINATVDIIYTSGQGENLLNASTPNHYKANDIMVYYLEDGQKTPAYYPAGHALWGVNDTNSAQEKQLTVINPTRDEPKEGKTTTLIELEKGQADTLKAQYESGDGSFYVTKV